MAYVGGADETSTGSGPVKFKETRNAKIAVLKAGAAFAVYQVPTGTFAKRLQEINECLRNHRDADFKTGFTICGKNFNDFVDKWSAEVENADEGAVGDPEVERLISDIQAIKEDNQAVQEARDEKKKAEAEKKAQMDALASNVRDLGSQNMNKEHIPRGAARRARIRVLKRAVLCEIYLNHISLKMRQSCTV